MKKNYTLYQTRGFNRAIFVFMVVALLLPTFILTPSAARGENPVIPSAARELASEGTQTDSTTYVSYAQFIAEHPEKRGLFEDINPIVYINSDNLEKYGGTEPVVAECNMAQVNKLYVASEDFEQVTLLKVRISSAAELRTLDLNRLAGFENLEMIFILFEYDICGNQSEGCLPAKTATAVPATTKNVKVIWQLGIPE